MTCDKFLKHPSAQTSEYLNINLTKLVINPKKLDMDTSAVVLHATGDFYALPCRTVNETCTYFHALIRVQPIKTRMCHETRIQAIHIIEIWSVSSLSPEHEGVNDLEMAFLTPVEVIQPFLSTQ